MKISVCVGSSCHLRGSRDVLFNLQELISEYKLEGVVDIAATFCTGTCTKGVSVIIDEELIPCVTVDNTAEIFKKYILDKINL